MIQRVTKLYFELGVLFIFSSMLLSCSTHSDSETAQSDSGLMTIQQVDLSKSDSGSLLHVKSDKEIKYNIFKLLDPERIVVDVIDAKVGSDVPESIPGNDLVKEVKIQPVEDSLSSLVRFELVLSASANYVADLGSDGLSVRVVGSEVSAISPSESDSVANVEPKPEMVAPAPAPLPLETKTPEPAKIESNIAEAPPVAELKAEPTPAPAPAEVIPEEPPALPSVVADAKSPMAESEEAMSPSSEVVPMVPPAEELKPAKKGKNDKNGKGKDDVPLVNLKPVQNQEIAPVVSGEGGSLLTDLDTKIYTGRRVSLEFQDANVQDILRLIAEVSKLNIVTGDDVKGSLSLKLIDVPWDQALDIILATLGLDKMQHGNIIRIAPSEKLRKEREVALANDKAAKQLEPLRLKLLNVNYARANDLASRIRNLLSERGTVDIDERTNTLIIKDIREHLAKSESLVRALDTQTPQIRIEARIVLADDKFSRDLGIQWGPALKLNADNQRERSWQFPRTITAGSADVGTMQLGNYMVDALPGDAKFGGFGFRLGSVSDIFNLDLQLKYLENESLGRVVSRPSISVLDNKSAKITQGSRVPFLSAGQNGTNVQFQDVGITIEVTPQVTSDGSVLLKISTRNNEVGASSVGGNPIQVIREAQTEMLVKSGRTAVLGGVFKTSETLSKAGVPGLMRLPVLGWLFSNKSRNTVREETLVFITPYILNDRRLATTGPSSETSLEQ